MANETANKVTTKVGAVTVTARFDDCKVSPFRDENDRFANTPVNCYKVTVKRDGGKQFTFNFYDSIHNTESKDIYHDDLLPSILSSIRSDYYINSENYPSFESFCGEFGYDTDSRRAERTYKTCMKHGDKLQEVFTEEEIETIQD